MLELHLSVAFVWFPSSLCVLLDGHIMFHIIGSLQVVLKLQRRFRECKSRAKKKRSKSKQIKPAVVPDGSLELLQNYFCDGVKGFCIYLCGSTGIVGDSLRYLRMMAGMGYIVLAPDMLVSAVCYL